MSNSNETEKTNATKTWPEIFPVTFGPGINFLDEPYYEGRDFLYADDPSEIPACEAFAERIALSHNLLRNEPDPSAFVSKAKESDAVITDQDKQLSLLRGENAKLKEEIQESDKEAEEWERAAIMAEAKYNAAQQDNAKLREALEEIKTESMKDQHRNYWFYRVSATALSTLQGETKDGWISVEDRLPVDGGRYLGYCREVNDLGVSHFIWNVAYHEKGGWTDNGELISVTHWRPLLAPPESLLTNNK